MMDHLEKLRAASHDWNDEYLAGQYDLGPTAYATEAAWEIIRSECQHRELAIYQRNESGEPEESNGADESNGAGETPKGHTSYAASRLLEGSSYITVISELIERGLVAGEAHKLVRNLAESVC